MLLAEIAVVLIVAKLAGELAGRWDQPPVLGQLIAGLALGVGMSVIDIPTLSAATVEMGVFSNLGVLLLMFLAGLETDWDQLRATGRAAFVAASLGVAVPLVAGYALGLAFGLPPTEAMFLGVILTATSVSITAQTLMELGSLQTIEGATILGAAVIDDVIGLVVFSIAVATTGSGGADSSSLPLLAASLIVFFAASATVMPWVIGRLLRFVDGLRGSEVALAFALAIALLYGVAAERAGLAAITGAYTAGLLINRGNAHPAIVDRTRVIAYGFFVPIFLVKTGMDAQLSALGGVLGLVLLTTLVAVVAKIVGSGLGARVCGLDNRQSFVVGVGMVSRGEVALVVAALALAAGAISQVVFSAAVIVVVATTLVTPPLLRFALAVANSGNEPGLRTSEDTRAGGSPNRPVAPRAAQPEP